MAKLSKKDEPGKAGSHKVGPCQIEAQKGPNGPPISETHDHLQAILENVPDRIYVKDTQSRFLKLSRALAARLGLEEPRQAIGKTDSDFIGPERAQEFYQDEQRIMQTGKPIINKLEKQILPNGQIAWTSTTKIPIRDQAGNVIGLVGINRDVTAQKEAEEALRRSHDELEQRVAERNAELSQKNAELARANEALASAYSQLQAMLENIPDRIYIKDRESHFLRISRSLAAGFGLEDPSAAIGKTDFDFHSPENARNYFADEQQILKTGRPLINHITRQTDVDGKVTWVSVTKVPLRDAAGKTFGLVGINRDITEQKQAEEDLLKSRNELEHRVAERTAELSARNAELARANETQIQTHSLVEAMLENIPDRIYFKDANSRFVKLSKALAKRLGLQDPSQAIGKTDFDFIATEKAKEFFADEQRIIQTGEPLINKIEKQILANGEPAWTSTTKVPLRNPDGKPIGIVGINRDITALKEAERKLEAVHKELLDVSRQAGMAEVATGVLHNVGNVVNSVNVAGAIITEQLRNSKVSGIAKVAKMLLDNKDNLGRFMTEDARGRHVPGYLKQLGERMELERLQISKELDGLVKNIEHIKEIVATQQNYAKKIGVVESVDPASLIADALRIHSGAYERHGITLVREFESLPPISIDKHKALQIVVNLFSNAKYACDGGTAPCKQVTVRLKASGAGKVKIEVADNGMGIPPEIMPRIFSQGFTTRKAGHGFGLHTGVITAKELGGALTVHSDGINKGATFTLELPLNPPPEPRHATVIKV